MQGKTRFMAACVAASVALLVAGAASASNVRGQIFCDANQSKEIDDGDLVLQGIQVFVDHESGAFFADTTAADGTYFVGNLPQGVHTSYLNAATLPPDGSIIGEEAFIFEITPTDFNKYKDWLIDSAVCRAPVCGDGIIDEGEVCDDGNNENGDGCSAVCSDEGVEGCTPGYWKQPQHFDSWTAPITPDTAFSDVFEDAFPGMTLVEVLAQGGGGLNALGRHIVAALLNSVSADVSYGASTSQVIDSFDGVYPGSKSDYTGVKDGFADLNEIGCPLN